MLVLYVLCPIFLVVASFVLGVWVGQSTERGSWLLRAIRPGNRDGTARHCNGEFYYIIREDVFVMEYFRKIEDETNAP